MEITIIEAESPLEKKVILHNPQTGEKVVILPEIGAALVELELICDHVLIPIVHIPGEKSIHENTLYPSALLTPWVNRVRNGNYSFEGRNFQLPINEVKLGNAIHGFLARKPFEIFEQKCTHELAEISFIHQHNGDFQGFPFPFIFTLTYRLTKDGAFSVQFACKNTGNSQMPFACGWHPYFKIAHAQISQLEIKFSPTLKYISDAQMIPMAEEISSISMPVRFSETTLDHVFKLEKQGDHLTELTDNHSKISLFLKQNTFEFPYLVVFVPPSENCVAIEPMTGNTDAFNTGDGLKVLSPNEEFTSLVEIWVDKANMG
jgi:aldose 1-epimerase